MKSPLFVLVLFSTLIVAVQADLCDVYKETMQQLKALKKMNLEDPKSREEKQYPFYTEDAIVTVGGGHSKPIREFYAELDLDVKTFDIHVLDIRCAPHQWCHLKGLITYTDMHENAISFEEFMTLLFEDDSCLVKHLIVLNDSRDVTRLIEAFSKGLPDKEL